MYSVLMKPSSIFPYQMGGLVLNYPDQNKPQWTTIPNHIVVYEFKCNLFEAMFLREWFILKKNEGEQIFWKFPRHVKVDNRRILEPPTLLLPGSSVSSGSIRNPIHPWSNQNSMNIQQENFDEYVRYIQSIMDDPNYNKTMQFPICVLSIVKPLPKFIPSLFLSPMNDLQVIYDITELYGRKKISTIALPKHWLVHIQYVDAIKNEFYRYNLFLPEKYPQKILDFHHKKRPHGEKQNHLVKH